MPKANTDRGRLRQVENWLRATYPLVAPVQVRVRYLAPDKDGLPTEGLFHRTGKRFSISIAPGPLDQMIDALLHEWAHMLAWSPVLEQMDVEHPPEFGLWEARLRTDFYDEKGWKDAAEYPAS